MSGKRIKCIAHIRHNPTGVVRKFPTEEPADMETFLWEEGNFGCDCNRRLFFARAAGEEEQWDGPCGHTEYSVNLERVEGGYVYYREFVS